MIKFHKKTKAEINKLGKIINTNDDNIVFEDDNYVQIAKNIFNLQQNIIDNYAFSRMLKQKLLQILLCTKLINPKLLKRKQYFFVFYSL